MTDRDLGRAVLRLATDDSALKAGMAASRAETSAAIQSATAHLRNVGTQLTATGQKMTLGVTLPIVAAGKAIVDVGANFDTTLRQIVGLAGVSQDKIAGIRERVLELGGEVGKTPQELAEAFYFVASAGFEADEAMDVLETSARASAAGLGRVQDVAKVLGLTINAYGHENITAAKAADILTAAVRDGTAEADAFAGVLGRVVPTAAQMGVSFDQVTAALASMTLTGLSAEEAATSLNQVLVSLLKPTRDAEDALEGMGTSSAAIREELRGRGLLAALRDLEARFAGNDEAAAKVFGNVRALRGVLSLLTLNADQLNEVFGDTKGALGDLEEGYQATEGPARDMARAQAELDAELIELSEDVLPVVIDLMRHVVEIVKGAVGAFKELPEPVRATVVEMLALAALAGPILVFSGAVLSAAGAVGKLVIAAGPAIPIILALSGALSEYNRISDEIEAGGNPVADDAQWAIDHPWIPGWLRGVAEALGLVSVEAPKVVPVLDAAGQAAYDAAQDTRESARIMAQSLPKVVTAYEETAAAGPEAYKDRQKAALDKAIADQVAYSDAALQLLLDFRRDIETAFKVAQDAALDFERTTVDIAEKQAELTALDEEYTKNHKKWTDLQTAQWQLRKNEALAEMAALKLHLALIGDDIQKTSGLQALLASKGMKDGLTSKFPETQAAYRALRDEALEKLHEIELKGGPAGKAAAAAIAKYMDPANPLSPLHDAGGWGGEAGREYIAGLAEAIRLNTWRIQRALHLPAALLEAASPPRSPDNPLHHIDDWGERTGMSWVERVVAAIASAPALIRGALGNTAAVLAGGFAPMPGLAAAAAGAGVGGGFSRNVAVPAQAQAGGWSGPLVSIGHIDARGHDDPEAVGDAIAQKVGDAVATVLRDQSLRGPTGVKP